LPPSLRLAHAPEFDLMARIAGLRLRERWGGWNGEPYTASSWRHVSVYEHGWHDRGTTGTSTAGRGSRACCEQGMRGAQACGGRQGSAPENRLPTMTAAGRALRSSLPWYFWLP